MHATVLHEPGAVRFEERPAPTTLTPLTSPSLWRKSPTAVVRGMSVAPSRRCCGREHRLGGTP
jgi:hypothetical protein